jgi:hypothetical protein
MITRCSVRRNFEAENIYAAEIESEARMHKPANDDQRVSFLRSLNILDTEPDPAFDCIVEAASTSRIPPSPWSASLIAIGNGSSPESV